MQSIMQKVHRPELIRSICLGKFDSALRSTFSSSAYSDRKLFFAINALCALFVNYQAFTLQKSMKPAATESLSLFSKLSHPLPEGFITIWRLFM
jgi:hypothetical protein